MAAPHEGFDSHTAPIARHVADRLGAGWVVGSSYRKPKQRRWFDVNRPTERRWVGGKIEKKRRTTRLAARVYAAYQHRLREAAGRERLALLVEIHGHARSVKVDGRKVKVQVVELATVGFSLHELRAIQARWRKLSLSLHFDERVSLYVDKLDPTYRWRGKELKFKLKATGARTTGALRTTHTERALHFELPPKVRFDRVVRVRYGELLTQLVGLAHTVARARPGHDTTSSD